jgi:hypothetical protein
LTIAAIVACSPASGAFAGTDPLPGIAIVVRSMEERRTEPAVAEIVTDSSGSFVLRNLTRGTYSVEYDRRSFAAAMSKAGGSAKARCSLTVTQVSSEPVSPVQRVQSLDFACGAADPFTDSAFIAQDKRSYRLSVTVER